MTRLLATIFTRRRYIPGGASGDGVYFFDNDLIDDVSLIGHILSNHGYMQQKEPFEKLSGLDHNCSPNRVIGRPCNTNMIMSNYAKVEMSETGAAIISRVKEGGGYGRRGHYHVEAKGVTEAPHTKETERGID
ncbi:MAG: hypothetical protein ACMUIL_06860 [bacterium]